MTYDNAQDVSNASNNYREQQEEAAQSMQVSSPSHSNVVWMVKGNKKERA